MNQQIRYIVETLNHEPYNKSFTIVSFDSLDPAALLQILNDVLAQISPEHKVNLREEPPDQTAFRMFSFLRVIKYKPKNDVGQGMNTFRQGLMQGEKRTVYPLLQWILERVHDLKMRAYLARFLVKVEVPPEHLQDETVADTNQTYEEMLDNFKELHKAVEQEHSSQYNTADVRKDIQSMLEEKHQLERQLERLRKRSESLPKHKEMLIAVQKLRKEKAQRLKLEEQYSVQRNLLLHARQKSQRLSNEIADLRSSSKGLSASAIISRMEEENRVEHLLVSSKLPEQIVTKRKQCLEMEKVLVEPVTSEADLKGIQQQISNTQAEIQALVEKRLNETVSGLENLPMFRQQAFIITNKKVTATETFKSLRSDVESVEKQLAAKKQELDDMGGAALISEAEFKKYIGRLRSLSNMYKQRKSELSALKAEVGVLSRTEEILKSRAKDLDVVLTSLEKKKGVAGFRETKEMLEKVSNTKSIMDEQKEQVLTDMSNNVDLLVKSIEKKKVTLAPLIRRVRPLRQNHQELLAVHTEKKLSYDTMFTGLHSDRAQLEKEVRDLWEECVGEESRYHYLQCMLHSIDVHRQRVAMEMKSIVSKDPAERKKSMRDQLARKIQEEETLSRGLRDKQREIKDSHEYALRQVKMWQDLLSVFQVKHESFRKREDQQKLQAKAAAAELANSEERLVLN